MYRLPAVFLEGSKPDFLYESVESEAVGSYGCAQKNKFKISQMSHSRMF